MEFLGLSATELGLWSLFGLVTGFIAHRIDTGDVKGGLIATMLLGIIGAIAGGVMAIQVLRIAAEGYASEALLAAIIGGIVLAFIYRLLFRNKGSFKTNTTQLR